jgi:hypothetical protein
VTALDDRDRELIARARKLAAALSLDEVRAVTGMECRDTALVDADALALAQHLLGELAAIVTRQLDEDQGQGAAPVAEATRRLDAIRGVLGPFETEREARAAAHALMPPVEGRSILSAAQNRQLLGRACESAGVTMGRYDDRIVGWLAGWEDATCAVIAGLISRANRAGVVFTTGQEAVIAQALDDAEQYRRRRAADWCGDCETAPEGACEKHLEDLDQADAYRDLAARLAGGAS